MIWLILAFAFFTRIFNISYPSNFYFDEVYNAFTTLEFAKNNKNAYEWFHTSPVIGTAYGWTHPPLAKLIDVLGILAFGPNAFGWRIVNVFLGVGIIFLIYKISQHLLMSEKYALLAAALASLDGLLLVQSRINMNDIVATFFILLCFYVFIIYQKHQTRLVLFGFGLTLGLLLATKWTGLYALAFFGTWIGWQNLTKIRKWPAILIALIFVPATVYLLSYSQYFILGGTWQNFWELQRQMWWYNTTLKATHTYQSSWWTWPFMLRPVWYFVDYQKDSIANIYALGNPLLWWLGIPAILYTLFAAIKIKSWRLWLIIAGYSIFWLPWARAPRIMFLYHFLPSIPFLCIAFAYTLSRLPRSLTLISIFLCLISFMYFYPQWVGLHIPKSLAASYFWLSSWH